MPEDGSDILLPPKHPGLIADTSLRWPNLWPGHSAWPTISTQWLGNEEKWLLWSPSARQCFHNLEESVTELRLALKYVLQVFPLCKHTQATSQSHFLLTLWNPGATGHKNAIFQKSLHIRQVHLLCAATLQKKAFLLVSVIKSQREQWVPESIPQFFVA